MPSILDLPEPKRSEALRSRGMTEDQFRRYLEDFKAQVEADTNERGALHYDANPEQDANPSLNVVNNPGEE